MARCDYSFYCVFEVNGQCEYSKTGGRLKRCEHRVSEQALDEIERLEKVCDDRARMIQEDTRKIERLQAVAEAAKEYHGALDSETFNGLRISSAKVKLEQALQAAGYEEAGAND